VTVYLDHAATSPPRPEARETLVRWLDAANASGRHLGAQAARGAVEEARERVAALLGASPHDVVFTSGGTEADNLVVKGVVWAARERTGAVPHVVTTAVEHAAVLEPARWLAARGEATVTEVVPDADGRVAVDAVLDALRPDTALVSVMAANNELGAVNDLAALGRALAERDVVLHADAVQAVATRGLDVGGSHLDAASLSAHKFGGPQGVGVAVLRRGTALDPLAHGGGQDRGVRSGTFAVGLIAALAAALEAADRDRPELDARLADLSDRLADGLLAIDGVRRNGPARRADRLSSHVHLSIDGIDGDALALALDRVEVAASSGSACGSGAGHPSHVVAACGLEGVPLRLSLGWTTTSEEVDEAIGRIGDAIGTLRSRFVPSLAPLPAPR
jgi:cysteine desulfurase